MRICCEFPTLWKRAIALFLVAAIPIANLPLTNVHAHENAYAGHDHGHGHGHEHSHFIADRGASDSVDLRAGADDSEGRSKLHVHDLAATVLMPVESAAIPAAPVLTSLAADRPDGRPPDKIFPPLFRPPIA
jgi:hypothetical protein